MIKRNLSSFKKTFGWVEYVLSHTEELLIAPEHSPEHQSRRNHDHLIDGSGLPYRGRYIDIYDDEDNGSHGQGYQQLLADARLERFSHVAIATANGFGDTDVENLLGLDALSALGITVWSATFPNLDLGRPGGYRG